MTDTRTKQEIYDALLRHKIDEILAICHDHHIEHMLVFEIGEPGDQTFRTSASDVRSGRIELALSMLVADSEEDIKAICAAISFDAQ